MKCEQTPCSPYKLEQVNNSVVKLKSYIFYSWTSFCICVNLKNLFLLDIIADKPHFTLIKAYAYTALEIHIKSSMETNERKTVDSETKPDTELMSLVFTHISSHVFPLLN